MRNVILSTPMMIEVGTYEMVEISLEEAQAIVAQGVVNYSGHQTVKMLGIQPAAGREECKGYDQALVVSPLRRLEFGREYSLDEIAQVGVRCLLIRRKG